MRYAVWLMASLTLGGVAVACLGNPDPGDTKVYCPEGKETFDDDETTEEAASPGSLVLRRLFFRKLAQNGMSSPASPEISVFVATGPQFLLEASAALRETPVAPLQMPPGHLI